MIFLADTSVLTRLAIKPVRDALRALFDSGRVARCAMTGLEFGFSARNGNEWDTIRSALGPFDRAELAVRDFRRAEQVQRIPAGSID